MGIALSPDGKTFATASTNMTARPWNVATRKPIGRILEHQGPIRHVAISPDGRMAVTGSEDGTARLWDIPTQWPIGPPLVHGRGVSAVAFSPDPRVIVTGSLDRTARLSSLATPVGGPPAAVELWIEVLTGMELGERGSIHWLDEQAWNERRKELDQLSPLDAGRALGAGLLPPPNAPTSNHARPVRDGPSRAVSPATTAGACHQLDAAEKRETTLST